MSGGIGGTIGAGRKAVSSSLTPVTIAHGTTPGQGQKTTKNMETIKAFLADRRGRRCAVRLVTMYGVLLVAALLALWFFSVMCPLRGFGTFMAGMCALSAVVHTADEVGAYLRGED